MALVRWTFTDVRDAVVYTFEVNPNEGGTPSISKQLATNMPLGPGRRSVFSEGRLSVTDMQFGGVILTQTQLEAMEQWFLKRTLIQIDDDLGRTYQGALNSFSASRVRRAFNPWYHTYSASLDVTFMSNASGVVLYGLFAGG